MAVFASPLALLACAGPLPLTARQSSTEIRALDPTGQFSLRNVNGSVDVSTWSEPNVRIEIEKAATSERALAEIDVRIEGKAGRVSVTTRHPKGEFFGPRGEVRFRITVPATATLDLESVNGRVRVTDAAGAVRASTVNGSVELDGSLPEVDARTVNGSIRVSCPKVEGAGRRSFSTTNGSIRVRLPADASGDFEAQTVNGGIHTDFPLAVSGRFGPKSLRGRLGSGGGAYRLTTVNGAVRIERL